MKALSVRQPWPYFMEHYGKDIENRNWSTKVRGRVLIHASKGMTRQEYEDAMDFAFLDCGVANVGFDQDSLLRGGIVGSVEIVDCVQESDSPWFMGPNGLVLRDYRTLPFFPCRGALGLFPVDPPYDVCRGCGCWDGDCSGCIERTGEPCHWVEDDLCSACVEGNR